MYTLHLGNHKYPTMQDTLYDYAQKKLGQTVESETTTIKELQDAIGQLDITTSTSEPQLQGWALRKQRAKTTFTKQVKDFLKEKFVEGEKSKSKNNPQQVSALMRIITDDNATPLFAPEQCLTWQQIQSFWSQNAEKFRKELALEDDAPGVEDDVYTEDAQLSNIDTVIEEVLAAVMNNECD